MLEESNKKLLNQTKTSKVEIHLKNQIKNIN